jgi:hypothetical protein
MSASTSMRDGEIDYVRVVRQYGWWHYTPWLQVPIRYRQIPGHRCCIEIGKKPEKKKQPFQIVGDEEDVYGNKNCWAILMWRKNKSVRAFSRLEITRVIFNVWV